MRLRTGVAILAVVVPFAAVLDGTLWSEPQVTIDAGTAARASAEAGTSVPTLPQGSSTTTAAPGAALQAVVVPDVPAAPTADRLAPPVTDPPYRWTGPLPNYDGRGACTADQATAVTAAFISAGAELDTLVWALTIFSRESGCDHTRHNGNRGTGDDSYSLCMVNALAGHFGAHGALNGWDRNRMLTDFDYAVAACVELWRQCGRSPWRYGDYGCETPWELR